MAGKPKPFCTDCGKDLRLTATSCPQCGARRPEPIQDRAAKFGLEAAANVVVDGAIKLIF